MGNNSNGMIDFIHLLEREGELIRINYPLGTSLEIAELTDRLSKTTHQNKALLFENTGTSFPLLINAMGTEKRICMALGVEKLDDIARNIFDLLSNISSVKEAGWLEKLSLLPKLIEFSKWLPIHRNKKGACQAYIDLHPNINDLPILKCWPFDGGKFITLPIVHTKNLISGNRNVGMYRMQIFDHASTGLHWHLHKIGAKHFYEYQKQGLKMPVAVVLGGDPIYTYCATAPLPENIDEYILAGFLRKKRVELVNCITQPEIQVPSDADIVIEGYIDTSEDLANEGPFGDHTGYYSLEDLYPKFHITAITHRKHAIYPTTIVGIPPQEDAWIGKATERIFLAPIQLTMMPELVDMCMPYEGTFHNLSLFSFKKTFVGQAIKCMNTFWGAGQMMLNKILVAFDEDVDIQSRDFVGMLQKGLEHFNPSVQTLISRGPLDVLDHTSTKKGFGGKLGIDLSSPLDEEKIESYHFEPLRKIAPKTIHALSTNIVAVNTSLINDSGMPVLVCAIKDKTNIDVLRKKIISSKTLEGIKIIVFVDAKVNVQQLSLLSWVALNHIDPQRDTSVYERPSAYKKNKLTSTLFVDATSKIKLPSFLRDWPNPVCSDMKTIKKIDSVWNDLNVGEFVKSPSLDILPLCSPKGGAYAYRHPKKH